MTQGGINRDASVICNPASTVEARAGFRNRLRRAATVLPLALAMSVCAPLSWAQSLLGQGDFESGHLGDWEADGLDGGFTMVVGEGGCFSYNDTTGITLSGSHAALVRSSGAARLGSVGLLRSPAFDAGTGVVFDALSELSDGRRTRNPVHFSVAVLDESGNELAEHRLHTALVRLAGGCPSEPRNASFGRHFIDTSAWIGQRIRIEFRQRTNVRGAGYFTLIDNVRTFAANETPLLSGLPVAVAGSSFRWGNSLHLDGRLSRHPDYHPDEAPLRYTWYIDGIIEPREGRRVAIDDLPDGNHRVTLFVTDGANVVSDQTLVPVGVGGEDQFELEPETVLDPEDGMFDVDDGSFPMFDGVEEVPGAGRAVEQQPEVDDE